jgi:hypothetical protein
MGNTLSFSVGPCPTGFVGWIYALDASGTQSPTLLGFTGGDGKSYWISGSDNSANYPGQVHHDFFALGEYLMGIKSPGGNYSSFKIITATPTAPLSSFTSKYTANYQGASTDPATSWTVPTIGNVITTLAYSTDVGATSAMASAAAPVYRQIYKTGACAKGFIGYYTKTSTNMYQVATTLLVGLHGADGVAYPLLTAGGSPAFTATDGTKTLFKSGNFLVKVCATGGGTISPKLRLYTSTPTAGATLTEIVTDHEIYATLATSTGTGTGTGTGVPTACFVAPATQIITTFGYDVLLGKTADMTTADAPSTTTNIGNTVLYAVIGGGVLLLLLIIGYIIHRRNNSDDS